MAPNLTTASALFLEATEDSVGYQSKTQKPASAARSRSALQKVQVEHKDEPDQPAQQYKLEIRWRNVIAFLYLHVFTLYGLYLVFAAAKYQTTLWCKYDQLPFNDTFSRNKVASGQVFSEYFGFPCQNRSFHQLLQPHNHPGQVQQARSGRSAEWTQYGRHPSIFK
jgi:hypothetical protein